MAMIEERAEKAWSIYEYRDGCLYHTTFQDGYTIGANEQKAIDIEKAYEWLKSWFMDSKYYTPQEVLENFRKAMEE